MIKEIKFRVDIDGTERPYHLRGTKVYWYASEGHGYDGSTSYEQDTINEAFTEGTWIKIDEEAEEKTSGAITSDGKSSSYYDIELPSWLVARILVRQGEGKAYIKTEELITVGFDNDFDAGNIQKSLVRLWGSMKGKGKAGNDVPYEGNKIEYSVGKLKERYARQEEENAS